MESLKSLLVVFVVIQLTKSEMFDINEIKCKLEDSKCMTAAVQKATPLFLAGIPEIGVEVLDIMKLDPIKIDLSGLKLRITDGRLKGLRNAFIKNVKWDTSKNKIEVIYHCNLTLTGHYVTTGQLLILPINGDGELKLKIKNIMIKLSSDYVLKKKGENHHIHLTKFSLDFEVIDNAHYQLTNLFNGNKVLSDTMHNFINDNWKQITAEFGEPVIRAGANKIVNNVNTFFGKFPIEDITIM